jgi:hypothetical protein
MSELLLSAHQDGEEDCYFSLPAFIKSARNGITNFKLYPFKRTVLTSTGRESERTFGKGERVCLVTRTSTEFDAIFKGVGRLAFSKTQISRIRVVAATPDSDDSPREFLVVMRNGEDLVYVEDVFPYAWGGMRTKNVFPRYYWVEVNRLMQMDYNTIPGIPTEKTVSAYVEDEVDDKLSDDVARELYLVEELGRCSDEITELEIEKMVWRKESKKLRRENEMMRAELLRLEAEKEQLLRSTTNEVRRMRTQGRTDELNAMISADRSQSAFSSAPASTMSTGLVRRLPDDRGSEDRTSDSGDRPTKMARMRKVSPDKEEKEEGK